MQSVPKQLHNEYDRKIYFDFAEASKLNEDDELLAAWFMSSIMGSQAEKGVGWMPRGQRPKKGAESGETWLGSCKRAMSQSNPNGATPVRASGRIALLNA
jgi:hypothetical protein